MKKIEYLIYTKEVEPSMVVQQFKKDNIKCILALDVRSAVYYATGISAQCGEIVADVWMGAMRLEVLFLE